MTRILRLFSKLFSRARRPVVEIAIERQPEYRWCALGFRPVRRPDMAGE